MIYTIYICTYMHNAYLLWIQDHEKVSLTFLPSPSDIFMVCLTVWLNRTGLHYLLIVFPPKLKNKAANFADNKKQDGSLWWRLLPIHDFMRFILSYPTFGYTWQVKEFSCIWPCVNSCTLLVFVLVLACLLASTFSIRIAYKGNQ